jgi:hypothetical protein
MLIHTSTPARPKPPRKPQTEPQTEPPAKAQTKPASPNEFDVKPS